MPCQRAERRAKKLKKEIKNYLSPKKEATHRAHLFTVNGYTYPFVRDLRFACVPDPPETGPSWSGWKKSAWSRRRFSMLSYLYGIREGDLLFFFQADPQYPKDDVENRRGIRGIYKVAGDPFRGSTPVKHPKTQYEIRAECPACGRPYADLKEKCKVCGKNYPKVQVRKIYRNRPPGGAEPFRVHVLSARLPIEPRTVFARTLGDNRAYMDMSNPGPVWISRTDNVRGAGKGSSIRTLLPEEAAKWASLLATEPHQQIIRPSSPSYAPSAGNPIENYDGTLATYPRLRNSTTVEHEFHLNLHLSRTIDDSKSSIRGVLGNLLPQSDLEFWTSELPWGYTADTCDFVCTLNNGEKRHRVILFELKRGGIKKDALIEIMLYLRWVEQVCTQFADPPVSEIELIPVLIGKQNNLSRVPKDFKYSTRYLVGPQKTVSVKSPLIVKYEPVNRFKNSNSRNQYAKDIRYRDITKGVNQVGFIPPKGAAMTKVERNWVQNNLWPPT